MRANNPTPYTNMKRNLARTGEEEGKIQNKKKISNDYPLDLLTNLSHQEDMRLLAKS